MYLEAKDNIISLERGVLPCKLAHAGSLVPRHE